MIKSALIVVDMQNDFMTGGSLEVKGSAGILLAVNKLIRGFDIAVATKDWHPADHSSFASQCGVEPFESVDGQMKWPDHCVAGTWGSEFHKDLDISNVRAVFHKGMRKDFEEYSGLEKRSDGCSGVAHYLQGVNRKGEYDYITHLFVCGLALDYCVRATALDAVENFETFIVSDATQPVDESFKFDFEAKGIKLVSTEQALLAAKYGV